MFKTSAQGVKTLLRAFAGIKSQNHINRLILIASTQRSLVSTSKCNKKFIVKDHYEFDQKVINNDVPVIVNFHAEWCDPCQILTPKMIELLQNSDEIDLAVIDVDDNTELVEIFEVKAVPAVLAFRNGVVVDKFIGLNDENTIETLIDKLKQKNRRGVETADIAPKGSE